MLQRWVKVKLRVRVSGVARGGGEERGGKGWGGAGGGEGWGGEGQGVGEGRGGGWGWGGEGQGVRRRGAGDLLKYQACWYFWTSGIQPVFWYHLLVQSEDPGHWVLSTHTVLLSAGTTSTLQDSRRKSISHRILTNIIHFRVMPLPTICWHDSHQKSPLYFVLSIIRKKYSFWSNAAII